MTALPVLLPLNGLGSLSIIAYHPMTEPVLLSWLSVAVEQAKENTLPRFSLILLALFLLTKAMFH
jgi:hypothetical protein